MAPAPHITPAFAHAGVPLAFYLPPRWKDSVTASSSCCSVLGQTGPLMSSTMLGGSPAFFNCPSPAIRNGFSKSLVLAEINYKSGRNDITSHTMCWGEHSLSISLLRDNLNCSPSRVCLLMWLVAMSDTMCAKYSFSLP